MEINLLSVVIAGVTTGGLTCFAVQGGLLTTAIANSRKQQELTESLSKQSDFVPIVAFILGKALIYSVVGVILGSFGSFFRFNPSIQAVVQILIAVYMIGIAANLLNLHPLFRYFVLQPPSSLQRLVRKISKGNDLYTTPALLGLATILIPCGTTLAMEALAISSGSAVLGGLIMLTFVLSSSWVFIAVGLASSRLTEKLQGYFYKTSALVLFVLAAFSLNAGLNLLSFPYTLDTISKKTVTEPQTANANPALIEFEAQKVKITIDSRGYTPNTRILKKGIPVELTLESKNSYSCANAFAIPSLNILKLMPETGTEKITFTPTKLGKLPYSCSMGMFRGEFTVI